MSSLKYKVTLLSDVILNQKAASDGPNKTLDFIPGGCFLGIVASKLYEDGKSSMLSLFHSNTVRFGDAHPAHGNFRTLRVPAAMFYPKLGSATEELYISYCIPDDEKTQEDMRKIQLKQCRSGFYDFSTEPAIGVETKTSFAIKSAHDCQTRTSKKNAMYGYESLRKGMELYFSVEVDEDINTFSQLIDASIKGEHRIGRSRSAEYGLVKIENCDYEEIPSARNVCIQVVYADSRLIFLDNDAMPTFRPTGEQLGVKGGKVNWEKSQIRTFSYANWNAKRQCFDAERCGIEKGSVIVIEGGEVPEKSCYIGSFNNEGFGRVIYNPVFLQANAEMGKARYRLKAKDKEQKPKVVTVSSDTSLLKYLNKQKEIVDNTNSMYKKVKEWEDKNARYFAGKAFASQWGTIRALASLKKDNKTIFDQLFADQTGYLMHGIGEEKWREGGRRDILKTFIQELYKSYKYEEDVRMAIVNLSVEMAKRCRKEDK